ncbi:5-hydroxytryptamine receptor 2C-like [Crassostrea angulata]|uniref:5-hydroxytryptamine receptor 2C-like n=1 Tax=Magallana angulata TaxID=2784310 RepID=UPI0022B1EBB3|nr:5-hydroxytryptamine receptor 2C-like [Crassostrea angulata]
MPVGNVTAYYTKTSLEQGITNGMFLVENTSVQLKTNECPFYHGVLNGSVNCSENLAIVDEPRGYNWPILFLTPLIFFGVGGNILVCMAISLEKRLQSVTNYFLLSLAITDLLVCIIVMPFTVINDFAGYWLFGPIICNLYVTADVLMCTASILHLCTISLDRYMAIRSPLTTRNISKSVVVIKLAIVWVTSIAISSPITILGFINESNVFSNQHCALSNGNFKIYGSVCAFFIPLLIMVLSYGLTLYTLISQSQKLHAQGKENEQPVIRRSLSRKPLKRGTRVRFQTRNRSTHHQEEADEHLYTPIINRKSIPKTSLHSSMENMCEISSQKGTCATSPLIDNHHQSRKTPTKEFSMSDSSCHLNIDHGSNDQSKEIVPWTRTRLILPNGHTSNLRGLVRKHQLVLKATSILLMKKTHIKKLDDVHTEQKASKVIGIVFIIFVVCWAPFFILNIMTPLCKDCRIQPALFASFNWLGYISSTLNPIIYTMFNKTFKLTFKKLLLCRYDRIQRKQRVQSWMVSNGSFYHNGSDSNNSIDKCDTPC